ncbi:hypothetical protein SteCoe_18866 [Stentor coeruleus]|uniref:Uncharacterized protein n=1 Tax=Stentor coeruleus TaxID=5963 RepID=A0A1R2BVT8_9CILI|nr:hypothetical protein SteCoe_18866 [Stentor coeruleus]
MVSNDLCKKLVEDCIRNSRVPDNKRYAAHFEYLDLVNKLLQLKVEEDPRPLTPIIAKITKICVRSPEKTEEKTKTSKSFMKISVSPLIKAEKLLEGSKTERQLPKNGIGHMKSASRQISGFQTQQRLKTHQKSLSHQLSSSLKQLSVVRINIKK